MRKVAICALLALAAIGVVAQDEQEPLVEPEEPSSTSTSIARPTFTPTTLKAHFIEQFIDEESTGQRWTPSEATKKTPGGGETFSYVGQWEVEESSMYAAIVGDRGLVAKSKATHHAISAPFAEPLDPSKDTLVVQYEVKYQKGGNCGGGYIKLLEDGFQTKKTAGQEFSDKTPWVIMFGPDLTCPGTKVHFIFQHQNPLTKEFEEKHLSPAPSPLIRDTTMLYTLILNPDNTFEVLVNGESDKKGSLLENFKPPVNPDKEIDDPEDSKPEDWVDDARIKDPDAVKPDDWDEDAPMEILDEEAEKPEGWLDDEPETVPDPDAVKPEEWDDEEDGDWIPPTVRNPKCEEAPGCGEWKRPMKANPDYKGKWFAPLIDNPAYKGVWTPRKIPNPDYYEDLEPVKGLRKIGAIGIELWTMTEDILFDNIYIGNSPEEARQFAEETFFVKEKIEQELKDAIEPAAAEPEAKPFIQDPLGFIRERVISFIELAKVDPVLAFKTNPETGAALAGAALTLIGMVGVLFGAVGGSQKPVTKSAKKTDAPSPDDKKAASADKTPVAPAGGDKKDEPAVKKRGGK